MNLEYFFNLIQLFGVLLGLIGVFIVFKIQSLDTRINACRKNIVTTIAQSEAVESRSTQDYELESHYFFQFPKFEVNGSRAKDYDELVSHYFLVYDASLDDDLLEKTNAVISKYEADVRTLTGEPKNKVNRVMLYLISIRDEWNDLRKKKETVIRTMKYPIIISAVMILYGLFISTYYSFELVNNISDVSLMSLLIFIFIVLVFLSIIYISKYIYDSVDESK